MSLNSLIYPDASIAIDPLGPVNILHPLSRGLIGWWLAIPGGRSGFGTGKWRDLTYNRYDGTLTNMTPSSDWKTSTRQGGFGSLNFGAASDYVSVPSRMLGAIPSTSNITAACWIYPNSVGNYETVFDAAPSAGDRHLSVFLGGPGKTWVAVASNGGTDAFNDTSNTWTANEWQHLAVTFNRTAGSVKVYRNGKLTANHSTYGAGFTSVEWQIGGNPSTGGANFPGRQDCVMVWNRDLSAGEMWALYQETRAGCPNMLNRVQVPERPPTSILLRRIFRRLNTLVRM